MECLHCGHKVSGDAFVSDENVIHQRCLDEYRRHQAGFFHECPKCATTGKMETPNGSTHTEVVGLAYNEEPSCAYDGCRGCSHCINRTKTVIAIDRVTCNLCHGTGWLKEKPEPVTKIVDWKLP